MCHVRPVDAVFLYVIVKSNGIGEVGDKEATVSSINIHFPDEVPVGENEFWLHCCNGAKIS